MASASLLIAALMAVTVPALSVAAPHGATAANRPATTPVDQWAFGGSVSDVYSCTTTQCPGGTLTTNQTLSLNWNINLRWVVLYSQTNISASQTEYEAHAALGASVAFGYSACVTTTTCNVASLSLSGHGVETSTGFTNVTDGQVWLSAGSGSPADVSALAVSNASTKQAFNLTGSLSETVPGPDGISASATFDIGGSESSSISFPSALGLIPVNPLPGDTWNASEPFTASGTYVSGFSASEVVNSTSASYSTWTPGSVQGSGTLNVSGNDTGTSTLYDNYTNPPTTLVAQDIVLSFWGANYSASDGWVLASTSVYNDLFAGLLGTSTSGAQRAETAGPSLSPGSTSVTSPQNESAFYVRGSGFVGANLAGNASGLVSGQPGGPSINLTAGPEPVGTAEQQYTSITAGPSAGGIPLLIWVAVAVVAAVVVVAAVFVLRGRSTRPRSPAFQVSTTSAAPSAPPTAGTPPPPGPGAP